MDFGSAKATPLTGANLPPRADIVATRDSVEVELPPERTVQSAPAGEPIKLDLRARSDERTAQDSARRNADATRQSAGDDNQIESEILIEPLTRSVVLRKTDMVTGETTVQVPDQATLMLRLYTRQTAERARAESAAAFSSIERTA